MADDGDIALAAGPGGVDHIGQHLELLGFQGPGIEVEIDREVIGDWAAGAGAGARCRRGREPVRGTGGGAGWAAASRRTSEESSAVLQAWLAAAALGTVP